LGVDLIDCDREPAHNRLSRFRGLAGHRGNQAELQGFLRECRKGKDGRRRRGEEQASREIWNARSRRHRVTSLRVNPGLGRKGCASKNWPAVHGSSSFAKVFDWKTGKCACELNKSQAPLYTSFRARQCNRPRQELCTSRALNRPPAQQGANDARNRPEG